MQLIQFERRMQKFLVHALYLYFSNIDLKKYNKKLQNKV